MVPIVKQLCPGSRYIIKCPYTRVPQFIVVHNTGNSAPAVNEVTYMLNRPEEISFHMAIDNKEIRQALPFDRNAWASGDGSGRGNMNGIHIEICWSNHNPDTTSLTPAQVYEKFAVAERNAAEYIASLLKQYGWGLDKVTKHQDYDGKYCPHRTLQLGWERFLKMIKQFMEEEPELTESQVRAVVREEYAKLEDERAKKDASKWAKPALDFCKKQGLMVGDNNGNLRPQSHVTRQELAQVLYNQHRREKTVPTES